MAQGKVFEVSAADPQFSFQVEAPPDWRTQVMQPDPQSYLNPGKLEPVGAVLASYAAVVFTVSIRPWGGDMSVSEGFSRLCQAAGVETEPAAPARAGEFQAIGAMATMPTSAVPMRASIRFFEAGGWAHMLMALAPMPLWDAMAPTFERMFDTFRMPHAGVSTVPLTPAPEPTDLGAALATTSGDEPAEPALPEPAATGDVAPAGPTIERTAEELAAARQVAERFLEMVKSGDTEGAKGLLAGGQDGSITFGGAGKPGSYVLGEPHADGSAVIVPATLEVPSDGGPERQELPLVLLQADEDWRVDMDQSINRMLGFDLGGMMNDVGQAMGKAMASGMEAAFGEMSKLMSEEQEKPEEKDA